MEAYLKDLWTRIKADAKRAHKSLTMIVNSASALLSSVWLYLQTNPTALQDVLGILPQLSGLLDPKVLTAITFSVNLLNIALRFKTDKPMRAK